MPDKTKNHPAPPALSEALIEALEQAEDLAIRVAPKTPQARRAHFASLADITTEAATLAAAISILAAKSVSE